MAILPLRPLCESETQQTAFRPERGDGKIPIPRVNHFFPLIWESPQQEMPATLLIELLARDMGA